jgi:hypothetical protein
MTNNIVTVKVTQTVAPTPYTLQATGALISQGATLQAPGAYSLLTQLADLTPLLKGALAISTAAESGTTVTIGTTAPHGFTLGDTILLTIAGLLPAGYNGTYVCTITGASAFTYAAASGLGTATIGSAVYTPEDVAELVAMATTFFAQGNAVGVYVFELGAGNVNDGVAYLSAWITANSTPQIFYSYEVPRTWDGNANFLAMLANFENTTSLTYFYITTTLATYGLYSNLMKCARTLIESPSLGVYQANTFSAMAWSGGLVTATTTLAHGITVGEWFQVTGVVVTGLTSNTYNGWAQAVTGTTGSTLVWALASNPGTAVSYGSLLANYYANAAIPTTEFSISAWHYVELARAPSTINLVPPTAFSFLFGVTAFPVRGNYALLTTLKAAFVNWVGTGAEGGISNTVLFWGTGEDGRSTLYWYSVDWHQINLNLDLSNEIINGSNNPQAPLYFNQAGINRLQARAQGTLTRGIAFGLALSPSTCTAVPFPTYVTQNPSDYKSGIYNGLGATITPTTGFDQIVFSLNVTDFPTAGQQ